MGNFTENANNKDCYDIAHNILMNEDEAEACVAEATTAMPPYDSANPKLHIARLTRLFALDRYNQKEFSDENKGEHTNENTDTHADEMSAILNELEDCATNISTKGKKQDKKEENVVALQLSNIIDAFARTLSETDCKVFITRYFFADSISNIATRFKLSENGTNKTLMKCRKKLKAYLLDKGYTVGNETLFNSFTDIGDDLINHDRQAIAKERKWLKPLAIAASTFMAIVTGIVIGIIATLPDEITDRDIPNVYDLIKTGYVDTSLLPNYSLENSYEDSIISSDEIISLAFFSMDEYTLQYCEYKLADNDILKYCKGPEIEDLNIYTDFFTSMVPTYESEYFRLLGHNDMQYIIEESDDVYTLWEFDYMMRRDNEPFPYNDVLTLIYDIRSAVDITELLIVTDPSSEPIYGGLPVVEGKGQTNIIDNFYTIDYIYNILTNMTCYGPHNQKMIHSVSSVPEYEVSSIFDLNVKTSKGVTLDLLDFNTEYKCFYEIDNGIAYDELDYSTLIAISSLAIDDYATHTRNSPTELQIAATNISPTGLTLTVKQSDSGASDGIQVLDYYYIEKWYNNNWINVPISSSNNTVTYISTYDIPLFEPLDIEFSWENTNIALPSGEYRITTLVHVSPTNYYSDFSKEVVIQYTEFEIP